MKNPFKAFFVFVLVILMMFFLGSCATSSHGYNYQAHRKKSEKLVKRSVKMNKGRDLTHFKTRCGRRK